MSAGPLDEFTARLNLLTESACAVSDAELLRRFADAGDNAAFELLVWRYAGLVLGTCRRALGRTPDADDAFQATFLALARKAGAVSGDTLGGWLHTVARRSAARVRAAAARARPDSAALADLPAPPRRLPDDTTLVLDEEIGRLPEKLRAAFVLCELEGRTDSDAAARLGCPRGTVLSRLSRARAKLRERLARRGLAPVLVGMMVARPPAELVAATARAGVQFAAGAPGRGAGAVAATGVLRAMAADAVRPVAVLMAAGIALVLGAALLVRGAPPPPDAPAPPLPPALPVRAAPPPKPAPPAAPNYTLTLAGAKLTRLDGVQFSPDGKWLVGSGLVKGDADAVAVWDAATGKHVRTLTAADDVARGVIFAYDGKRFATPNGRLNSVVVWEVGTWKQAAALPHDEPTSAAFSPDGRWVATWSVPIFRANPRDGLKVWDAATGKLAFEHRVGGEAFMNAGFTADGKTLVAVTFPGEVRLIDTATGKVRHALATWAGQQVDVAVGPAGVLVSADGTGPGNGNGGAYLIDPDTGKTIRTFRDGQTVYDGHFSPDGKWVVTDDRATGKMSITVWDTATGKLSAKLVMTDPPAEPFGAAFIADRVVALRAGVPGAGEIRSYGLFDPATGKELIRIPNACGVALDPTGKTLAVLSDKNDQVIVRGLDDLLKGK